MILKYKLLPGAKAPFKKNPSDIGWDVFAYSMRIEGTEILPGVYRDLPYIEYNLGICIQPESAKVYPNQPDKTSWYETQKYYTYLAPRSSISDYNLSLCPGFGTIDAGYAKPVLARFRYLPQPQDYVFLDPNKHPSFGVSIDYSRIYKIGERCAQLNVTLQPEVNIMEVKEFNLTDRDGGHGSTGKL
jgi:dUTPase